ncbi:hypothetical protein E4T66_17205 [Sinimarinibacterium sp. CAU 1509]|uniref:patatin-like phospholipase family protein n=1 Tax=Sinimarinibacterium sp. CAU 1509 TaxID=2562283 RepID=UPI0010AC6514|nr:patatin-like phospholipase family protein [Sinimarinibacterium sp. CAU 1509]TJY57149.1 hypothetical protein E4T66_17205 [Sinimarinibacterium sp. CAU 1509]
MTTQPRPLFRILSMDGGGVRGAATAAFLAKLEADLGGSLTDHFDYFAGTSAGGLLALFLGGRGGTALAASSLFSPVAAARIMDKSVFDRVWPTALQFGPKYDGRGKSEVLAEVFGTARVRDSVKPVLVTAYDPAAKQFVVFKSHGGQYSASNPLMAQVADATSAAPVYFPPATVEGDQDYYLIDGGVGANNPAMAAVAAAIRAGVRPQDIVVVAVGTGRAAPTPEATEDFRKHAAGWGGVDWLRHGIVDHLIDASSSATDYWCSQMLGRRYVRVQGLLADGASTEMDDTSAANIAALRATGEAWFDDFGDRVRRAVHRPGIALDSIPELPAVCFPELDDDELQRVA